MSKDKITSIPGLPGLNNVSEDERQAFMLTNAEKLKKFAHQPKLQKEAADMLYNNSLFVKTFGRDAFNRLNNGTQEAYDYRNELLRDKAIGDQWDALYNPAKTEGKGLGNEYDKYNELSTDSKLKMLESDYLTPSEFEETWNNGGVQAVRQAAWTNAALGSMSPSNAMIAMQQGFKVQGAGSIPHPEEETTKQHRKEVNDRILEHIYSEEADNRANTLKPQVDELYSSKNVAGLNDDQIQELFQTEVTPNSYEGNVGIPEFAKFYIENPEKGAQKGEFTVDDMRKIISMKKVYEENLSPEMARVALDNYAKRFNKDHQNLGERAALLGKDILISSASYTADKVNGIYNIGLMATDEIKDKPIVLVDDKGEILDPKDPRLIQTEDGQILYNDTEGKTHSVHREQVSRATLHNLGKNFDGSTNHGILNPQDWTDREQFGVWDSDLAKEYKNINASPYKVAYDPEKDSDLWYEALKMTSFGLADGVAQLIPYGIGQAGRVLSTASKTSKVMSGFGKALDYTGKALTYQSKAGQLIQGGLGAAGIAYAYQRGSFQETLAQNLANADEILLDRSKQEIYNQYQSNDAYKQNIDALIDARAASIKAEYLAQLGSEGERQIIDKQGFDEMIRAKAQEAVLGEEVQSRMNQLKGTDEYAALQQEAIRSAGATANRTFIPEAVKYGLVNTIGYRKFLYTNPTGITKPVSPVLKGLKEITTAEGKQRMATEASKFLTTKSKWAQLGKTAGRMYWGGAWTNGSDDMMVDAAERVNEDSFNRYLNAFDRGEAISEVYSFGDGLYSYMNGLYNSLGQKTTWQAANVGGLGSFVSVNPNFANIASLSTKAGRDAYKSNYQERIVRNEDGSIKRDANGAPITEAIELSENWRDRVAFFLQNGVLNEYYGAKQTERDLQNHADYVNNLLDEYDDFKAIEDVLTSNIGVENALTTSDKKTMQFIHAIEQINLLNQLEKDKSDPTVMSSVVDRARTLIEKAAEMRFDGKEGSFTEEEATDLIAQYYANNPSLARSEYNSQKALYDIAQNAQKLQEAAKALNDAQQKVQKLENSLGTTIPSSVKSRMAINQALGVHWTERLDQMKQEIGDPTSQTTGEVSDDMLIPSLGGRKNAEDLIKVYDKQEREFIKAIDEQKKEVAKAKQKADEKEAVLRVAQRDGQNEFVATKEYQDAKAELEAAQLQESFIQEQMATSQKKADRIKKVLALPVEEGTPDRVLTADEVFNLDVTTRARMMNPVNRYLYSEQQQGQLFDLEKRLLMKDGDALQKIQDIALLTQRIASNEDAYGRMAKNPEAAAAQLEAERVQSADAAYKLINRRNAEAVTAAINEYEKYADGNGISEQNKEDFVFRLLSKNNVQNVLSIIQEEKLLPKYQKQVEDAIEFTSVLSDIVSVINASDKSREWKENISREVDHIVARARSRQDIMSELEKVRRDVNDPQVAADFEEVLSGLEALGYQRDATIIEDRKQKEQRKEEAAKKKESEEDAKIAAAKAQAEEQEKWEAAQAQTAHPISQDGADAISWDVAPVDEDASQTKDEDIKPETYDWGTESSTEVVNTTNIIEGEDTVEGKSSTIDEQVAEASATQGKEVHSSDETTDVASLNSLGEYSTDTNVTTLSGNAMSEWKPDVLQSEGKLEHKEGTKEGDSMNQYYNWMKNIGIKLQNIIDDELSAILQRNPQAKVKFMAVKPETNATNDVAMQNHLMLVLDFDDSINKGITSVHNSENGGVIEADGKKYLVVGTVGYNRGNTTKQSLYNILFSSAAKQEGQGIIKKARKQYFDAHPNERFYVHNGLDTEIVPTSLIPGYIVKQLEGEENAEYRSITDLLNDPARNPHGLDMESLAWGIQEYNKFLVVGTSLDKVMVPRNSNRNAGSAFVLIPAANGKFVASYLKPLFNNEIRDGKLKDRIYDATLRLTSPDYAMRLSAVQELSRIFHFDKKGNNILIGKDGTKHQNEVSFVQNGQVTKTFTIDANIDTQAFLDAFAQMNPRVNITADVLRSPVLLQQYNEAGALQTDIAKIGTAGSSYSIYAVDAQGNILRTDAVNNEVPKTEYNSAYRNQNKSQVVYNYQYYSYDTGTGNYSLNGQMVTDDNTIRDLDYNRRIAEGELIPARKDGNSEYYIVSANDDPQVIKVDKNTKKVEELSQEQSKQFIDEINKQKEDAAREEAARIAMEKAIEDAPVVDLGLEEETSEELFEAQEEKEEKREIKEEEETPSKPQSQRDFTHRNVAKTNTEPSAIGTQTFENVISNGKYMMRVVQVIKNKWSNAPSKISDLKEFLKGKSVEVDAIGTSEADVEAWIKTIEDCR